MKEIDNIILPIPQNYILYRKNFLSNVDNQIITIPSDTELIQKYLSYEYYQHIKDNFFVMLKTYYMSTCQGVGITRAYETHYDVSYSETGEIIQSCSFEVDNRINSTYMFTFIDSNRIQVYKANTSLRISKFLEFNKTI